MKTCNLVFMVSPERTLNQELSERLSNHMRSIGLTTIQMVTDNELYRFKRLQETMDKVEDSNVVFIVESALSPARFIASFDNMVEHLNLVTVEPFNHNEIASSRVTPDVTVNMSLANYSGINAMVTIITDKILKGVR